MLATHAIWWLTARDCRLIDAAGGLPMRFPSYLRDRYAARRGRAGDGLLFAGEPRRCGPWPGTALAAVLDDSCAGGVVLERRDLQLLAEMPGIITDGYLRQLAATTEVSR